jgi:hypothetical protein
MTTEKTQHKARRTDIFHESEMGTPDILSEVSSEGDQNFMSDILLTERSKKPEKLMVKMKGKNYNNSPRHFKSTFEKYLNKTEIRNILHSKHR